MAVTLEDTPGWPAWMPKLWYTLLCGTRTQARRDFAKRQRALEAAGYERVDDEARRRPWRRRLGTHARPGRLIPRRSLETPEARMHSPASIQHLIGERDLETRDGGRDGLIWAAVEAVALGGALSVTFYVLTTFVFLT